MHPGDARFSAAAYATAPRRARPALSMFWAALWSRCRLVPHSGQVVQGRVRSSRRLGPVAVHASSCYLYRRRARKLLGLSPNHYPHLYSSPDAKPVKARKTQLDRPWNLCGPRGVRARIDKDVGKSQGLSQGMPGPHGVPVSRPQARGGAGTAAQRSLFGHSTVRSGRAGPSGAHVAGCRRRSLSIYRMHIWGVSTAYGLASV